MKGKIKNSVTACAAFCIMSLVSCAVDPIRLTAPIGVPVAQNKVDSLVVRVSIEDVRGTQVLGSRGGLYSETSLISTDASLIDQIGDNFIQAMKTQGYIFAAQASANMSVKLEELTYQVDEINRTTKDSKVFAKMSFYVEHKKGYIQKSFNITLEQTSILLLTQKSIEALINDALIQVMQKGLDDAEIQGYIAQAQNMELMLVPGNVVEQVETTTQPTTDTPASEDPKSDQQKTFEQEETQTFKLLL